MLTVCPHPCLNDPELADGGQIGRVGMDSERVTYRALLMHLRDHDNDHAGRDWSASSVEDLRDEWRSGVDLDAYVDPFDYVYDEADAVESAYDMALENECAILSNEYHVSTCFTVCDCHDDEGHALCLTTGARIVDGQHREIAALLAGDGLHSVQGPLGRTGPCYSSADSVRADAWYKVAGILAERLDDAGDAVGHSVLVAIHG